MGGVLFNVTTAAGTLVYMALAARWAGRRHRTREARFQARKRAQATALLAYSLHPPTGPHCPSCGGAFGQHARYCPDGPAAERMAP